MSKFQFIPTQRLFLLTAPAPERFNWLGPANRRLRRRIGPRGDLIWSPGSPGQLTYGWDEQASRIDTLLRPDLKFSCITGPLRIGKSVCLRQAAYLREVADAGHICLTTTFSALPNRWEDYCHNESLWLARLVSKGITKLAGAGEPYVKQLSQQIRQRISQGKFTLLIDDFPLQNKHRQAAIELAEFLNRSPGIRCIVAGRPSAVQSNWNTLFDMTRLSWDFLLLDEFTLPERKQYVGEARAANLGGELNDLPAAFLETIREVSLDELRSVSRAKLYKRCLESLMEKAMDSQGTDLSVERVRRVLSVVAAEAAVEFGSVREESAEFALQDDRYDRVFNRLWSNNQDWFSQHAGCPDLDSLKSIVRSAALLDFGMETVVSSAPTSELSVASQRCIGWQNRFLMETLRREWKPVCPYPGMKPFLENGEYAFCGRDETIANVIADLQAKKMVLIVGPSGAGKSSLIYAGVLPSLSTSEHFAQVKSWKMVSFRPGAQAGNDRLVDQCYRDLGIPPGCEEKLGETLSRFAGGPAKEHLLVIIDQLEQLFADWGERPDSQHDWEELQQLIQTIAKSAGCYVLLTLRQDFLEPLQASSAWSYFSERRNELLPLQGANLKAAIREPSVQLGIGIEEGLLERLVADCRGQRGFLPFLQETLVYLWDRADSKTLTLAGYEALTRGLPEENGLVLAITRQADAALLNLTKPQQQLARDLLLRFVVFRTGGLPHTSRQQSLADLNDISSSQADLTAVLNRLIEYRLITSDGKLPETEVELGAGQSTAAAMKFFALSHDSLITGWERFQKWIKDHQLAEESRREIVSRAKSWMNSGMSNDKLLSRGELLEAKHLYNGKSLSPELSKFFLVSARRIRRNAIILSAAIVMMAGLASSIALIGYRLSIEQRRSSQTKDLLDKEEQRSMNTLARRSLIEGIRLCENARVDEGIAQMLPISRDPNIEQDIQQAVRLNIDAWNSHRATKVAELLASYESFLNDCHLNQAGDRLAYAAGKRVGIVDLNNLDERTFELDHYVDKVFWHYPTGFIVTIEHNQPAEWLEVSFYDEGLQKMHSHRVGCSRAAFLDSSPTGEFCTFQTDLDRTGMWQTNVIVLLTSGMRVQQIGRPGVRIDAWTQDGKSVLLDSFRNLELVHATTGQTVLDLEKPKGCVGSLLSDDGSCIATLQRDGTLIWWDSPSGDWVKEESVSPDLRLLRFMPGAKDILAYENSGNSVSLQLFPYEESRKITFPGFPTQKNVNEVKFLDGDKSLVSFTNNHSQMQTWDVSSRILVSNQAFSDRIAMVVRGKNGLILTSPSRFNRYALPSGLLAAHATLPYSPSAPVLFLSDGCHLAIDGKKTTRLLKFDTDGKLVASKEFENDIRGLGVCNNVLAPWENLGFDQITTSKGFVSIVRKEEDEGWDTLLVDFKDFSVEHLIPECGAIVHSAHGNLFCGRVAKSSTAKVFDLSRQTSPLITFHASKHVEISSDEEYLATCGKELTCLHLPSLHTTTTQLDSFANFLKFFPDRSLILVGDENGFLSIFDPHQLGKSLRSRQVSDSELRSSWFLRDRQRLLAADNRGKLVLLDLSDLQETVPPIYLDSPVTQIATTTDSSIALIARESGKIRMFHLATGLPISPDYQLPGFNPQVAYHAEGNFFIVRAENTLFHLRIPDDEHPPSDQ